MGVFVFPVAMASRSRGYMNIGRRMNLGGRTLLRHRPLSQHHTRVAGLEANTDSQSRNKTPICQLRI